jgi:hypothetical protein
MKCNVEIPNPKRQIPGKSKIQILKGDQARHFSPFGIYLGFGF